MNNILRLCFFVLMFSIGALCGFFYPQHDTSEINIENESISFDLGKNDYQQIINHINRKGVETLSGEIIILLRSGKTDVKSSFYLVAMMERLIKENPDAGIFSLRSSSFMRMNKDEKYKYVEMLFSALAKFYPNRFPSYFLELSTNESFLSPNGFLPYRDLALITFFNALIKESPEIAIRMLTDGSLDGIHKIQSVGAYTVALGIRMQIPPNSYVTKLTEFLEKATVVSSRNDFSDFLEKLEKTKDTNKHKDLIYDIADEFSEEDTMQILTLADNMDERDRITFLNRMISLEYLEDGKDWHRAWSYIEKMGIDNMEIPWQLNVVFIKAGKTDPEEVIDIIQKNLKGERREEALASVIYGLMNTKPAEQLLDIVNNLEDGICREKTMPVFFRKYYQQSPDDAISWLLNDQNDHSFIGDEIGLMNHGQREDAAIKILMAENTPDEMAYDIAKWFYRYPDEGFNIIAELGGNKRIQFIDSFYSEWKKHDPETAKNALSNAVFSEEERAYIENKFFN